MRTTYKMTNFVLLAVCVRGVAHAQQQGKLSWNVKTNLRYLVTDANQAFSRGVSVMAPQYLSLAV